MILADTSVWIDYLRSGDTALVVLLGRRRVVMHPMVLGELALGNLKDRASILEMWRELPGIEVASDEEVLALIDSAGLMGKGIGWIDAHLLAAVARSVGVRLWTRDQRLDGLAVQLGVSINSL